MKSNKQLKFKAGVFQIRNTVNGKIYIDSSSNLDKIWKRYSVELNAGSYANEQLQKDWKEFGEDYFKSEILSEIKQTDDQNVDYAKEARQLAKMFIKGLKPFGDKGYNKMP